MYDYAIEVVCPCCHSVTIINVDSDDYRDWRRGGLLVQDVFPYLSAGMREKLLTGLCENCWEKVFGEDENDEEEDENDW